MQVRDQSFTIASCVAAHARSFPERVAIEEVGPQRSATAGSSLADEIKRTWTYRDLWERTLCLATALSTVRPGPHGAMAAILLPNGADHIAAYLACQLAGVAAVPINIQLTGPEIDFIVQDSGASVLLTAKPFLDATVGLKADVDVLDTASVASGSDEGERPPSVSGDPADLDRLAIVAYTSGTTGFPKGVKVTNGDLLDRSAQWGWTFGLSPAHVLSTPGPIFHMSYGGLSLAHLVAGGYNRVMTEFDPHFALVEYTQHSSWVFLVPSMTAMIHDAWRAADQAPMSKLEVVLSSGAPGPHALLDAAFDMFPGAAILEAYGWTEGGWLTYEQKDRSTLTPHCVGWPMMRSELDLRNEQGESCGVGEPGEVVARPTTPFHGYLGRENATAAATTSDGFCRSGDVGILLPDGRLSIVDRIADMIISGGENVYCAEVERVLALHPSIDQVAVFGIPDDRWGEQVTAAVVLKQGHAGPTKKPTPDNLVTYAQAHLARYKAPKVFHIVDELPRNSMGKIQKFRLVESFSDSE